VVRGTGAGINTTKVLTYPRIFKPSVVGARRKTIGGPAPATPTIDNLKNICGFVIVGDTVGSRCFGPVPEHRHCPQQSSGSITLLLLSPTRPFASGPMAILLDVVRKPETTRWGDRQSGRL
jgi:hypothetical protein